MTASSATTIERLANRITAGELNSIGEVKAIPTYGGRKFQLMVRNPFTPIGDVFPVWGQDYETRLLRWAECISSREGH